MKKLLYLFFTAVVTLLMPACNEDPDFLKNMPSASGDESTEDDENVDNVGNSVDPNFQIYLCFGGTNMEGSAAIEPQDLEGVDERFKMMAVVSDGWEREAGNWYTATPPLCRSNTGLTPVDYFGRKMIEGLSENNPNIKIGVILIAVKEAGIKAFHKMDYQAYYESASEDIKSLMDYYDGYPYGKLVDMAREAQKQGVIKGILMQQGETDASEDYWEGAVKDIYDNLISDLGLKAEETPLLVGEMFQSDNYAVNNEKISNLPNTIPNCYVVSSENCLSVDDKNFSAEGYRQLGQNYAKTMLNVLAGLPQEEEPDNWFEFAEGKFGAVMGNPDAVYDWETGEVKGAFGFHGWNCNPAIDLTQSGKRYLVAKFKEVTGAAVPGLTLSSGNAAYVTPTKENLYSVVDLTQELKAESGEIIDPKKITYVALQCDGSSFTLDKVYLSDTNPLEQGEAEEPGDDDPTKWFDFGRVTNIPIWGATTSPSFDVRTNTVSYDGTGDIIIGWQFDGVGGNPSPLNLENCGYLVADLSIIEGQNPEFYISNDAGLSFSLYIESENRGEVDGKWYVVIDLGKDDYKDLNGKSVLLNNIQQVGFRTTTNAGQGGSYVVNKIYISETNPLEEETSVE